MRPTAGIHAREKMSLYTGTLFGPQGAPDDMSDFIPSEYSVDGSTALMEFEYYGERDEYGLRKHETIITVQRPDGTTRTKTFLPGWQEDPSGRPMLGGTQATRWLRRMGFPEVLAVV